MVSRTRIVFSANVAGNHRATINAEDSSNSLCRSCSLTSAAVVSVVQQGSALPNDLIIARRRRERFSFWTIRSAPWERPELTALVGKTQSKPCPR
jgi:hypothetical protein